MQTSSSASSEGGRGPSVTVLIPCFNYARFLGQCLTSVLTQTGVHVRALVIDDASTDHSAVVAREFSKTDGRVELLPLTKNIGMIPAVNLGLREVKSDYLVKLDADDLLTPGSLERSVTLLEHYPNVGFVYGRPHLFTGKDPHVGTVYGRPSQFTGEPPQSGHLEGLRATLRSGVAWLATRGLPDTTIWSGKTWLTHRFRRANNCICQPEAVIRRSALKAVGEYNAALPHTSDLEMWLRLALVSDVGRINRVSQGYYRLHPDSMQRTVNAGVLKDFGGRRDAFLSVLSSLNDRNPERITLDQIVRRELAVQVLDYACATSNKHGDISASAHELMQFAASTFPAASTLPQWKVLERRRQGRRGRWDPRSVSALIARRVRYEAQFYDWVRTGM